MHKFNSDKQQSPRAMDGILSSKPRSPRTIPGPSQLSRPRLDNFRRSEGFHGQQNVPLATSGALKSITFANAVKPRPQTNLYRRGNSALPKGDRAKSRRSRSTLKVFFWTSLIAVLLVLMTGGFLFGKAWWTTHKVFKGGSAGAPALTSNIDPALLNGEGDGRVNVLLLGIGGEGHDGADLTDSMMIASIDPINKATVLMSIPRDLWVKADGLWGMKINAVYSSQKQQYLSGHPKDLAGAKKAGEEKLESTIESYMGIPINYYTMVDFTAFKQAVDAVGGITVNVKDDLVDYNMAWENNNNPVLAKAGIQQMDGTKALQFARSRYGSARGDFDRADRQRQVMVDIKEKVLSVGTFANPIKVTQLLNTFGDRVVTNLSISEMMRIYEIGKQIDSSKISSTSLADPTKLLVTTDNIGGQSVVRPIAGLNDFDAIRAFVRTQLVDGYIKNENASIIVLNASGRAGAATARATELKNYGYNVIQVADAGQPGITGTQIIDQTKSVKKYTKRYLEKRLGVISQTGLSNFDLTPYTADFIIVIGQ